MKNYWLLIILFSLGIQNLHSQVIFSEDFSGGAIPTGFVLVNNDGKTPASSVSFVNNAWVVRNESSSNTNKVAVSTSWYNPAGASDDWLITPPITITTNNLLKWRAKAVDSSYPDGYQVKLSPTGDTSLASFSVNLFSVNAENPEWTERGVSLAAYSGQTVRIAFRNNSNDMFLLQLDDIQIFVAPDFDAGAISINNYRYYQQGNIVLSCTIKNYGINNINSVDVHWTYDGTNINTQSLTGLNINPYTEHTFNHSIPLVASGSGKFPVRIWTSNINGNADSNPSNDTSEVFAIYSVSSKPAKKTLLEEATGAWCQFCPDGAVKLMQVLNTNQNVRGYAVHDNDAMSTDQSDSINAAYASGFPTGYIDRFKFLNQESVDLSRTLWANYCTTRNNQAVPFGLSMTHTYQAFNRTVTVTLSAESKINADDRDYRLGIVVVQDSMTGTGTGWDQANYYDTQSGHPYYQAGDPIVGYHHRYVARWWPLGVWGTSAIPQNVSDGSTYNQSFTFTLPNDYDENQIYIYGLVQEFTSDINERPIFNVVAQKLDLSTTGVSSSNTIQGLEIYPNPAQNFATISFSLEHKDIVNIQVIDITGKTVYKNSIEYFQGVQEFTINTSEFSNGTYLVNVTTSNHSLSKKLIINR